MLGWKVWKHKTEWMPILHFTFIDIYFYTVVWPLFCTCCMCIRVWCYFFLFYLLIQWGELSKTPIQWEKFSINLLLVQRYTAHNEYKKALKINLFLKAEFNYVSAFSIATRAPGQSEHVAFYLIKDNNQLSWEDRKQISLCQFSRMKSLWYIPLSLARLF